MPAVGSGVLTALVHELFERRASASPDALAVRFMDARLSYSALNAQSNQLARCLEARGIGREDRVVVCVEPGLDIVVALLAILKLGAVYVPLDPSHPRARIRVMLDDTAPALLLTRSELSERLPLERVTTLIFESVSPELRTLSTENLGKSVDPEQTAYVYYTSGTTGVPKGVMASQANLASYIDVAQRRYGFTSADVGPALARFSFSISMFELLSPLVAGGTLLLLERAHILDLGRLCQTLPEVTFFHAGPSLLRNLLKYARRHYPDFAAFSRVRHASSGGDMVPLEVLEGLREVFFNAEVFVIYGCSEISCMGCTYPVPRGAPLLRSYVGKPFDGTCMRVVDEELRPTPVGVTGEVLFAGPGIVKGYLKRPELTSQSFVQLEGQRFYRTGDRGRIGSDGLLELLGRSDFQVKLGGMRIELGEIEHHLRRAPGVTSGVVVAHDLGGEEQTLVAYVVMDAEDSQGSSARAATIRRHLAEQLPGYMVPATYVELAALPLNHNQKIDRSVLPKPPSQRLRVVEATELREPATPTERRLALLWQRVLSVDQLGLDDNFFEVGGTSMLALQLIVEIDAEFGVTLTGLELLRESLAMQAEICERRSGQAGPGLQPSTPRPARAPPLAASSGAGSRELFHFGPGQSLFGVLHTPSQLGADTAALICAPIGHEYVRAHFILQRLASRLTAAGVPVLRFDYYGCRDALGEGHDATSTRWQSDILVAYSELKRRTKATLVTGIGVRLGATLLASVASRLDLASLVLWDPIARGAEHHAELCAAQQQYLRANAQLSRRSRRVGTWRGRGVHELLGCAYSETALAELRALVMPALEAGSPAVQILSSASAWLDLAHLEDMLPDVGTSRALTQMVLTRP